MADIERKKFNPTNRPRTTYEAVRQDLSDLSTEALSDLIGRCQQGTEQGLRTGVRGLSGTNYGPAVDGDLATMLENAQTTLASRQVNTLGDRNG